MTVKSKARSSFGLQHFDRKLSDFLKPIFSSSKKEFILINNIAKNWEDIVGKNYSKFCYPKSISFSKNGSGVKLVIAAHNASIGFLLENSSNLIIERIAVFHGFRSISQIVIKQEPKIIDVSAASQIKLLEEEENFLQKATSKINDENLANTIRELGKKIIANNKKNT